MIKRFEVTKLHGINNLNFAYDFYNDVNVFTGKNGSGKTTILKLLWYLVSGNIERIFPEITFESALIEGDGFHLKIDVDECDQEEVATVTWNVGGNPKTAEFPTRACSEDDVTYSIDRTIARATGSSVFFPTFRRIEGGFSIANRSRSRSRQSNPLQEGIAKLSDSLSFMKHMFVSSIAIDDIELLLTSQYAKTSEESNRLQGELSKYIEVEIRGWEQTDGASDEENLRKAGSILTAIKSNVREFEGKREVLLKPFTVLTELVGELLRHKGIRVRDITTFGEVSAAIEAGNLSAGEKQMFSFLCYNAFATKSIIFIDEPEISLHVDWQRILLPKLMEQGSDNQFIISTHSPFIYTKYSDREIRLDQDRGAMDDE